MGQARSGLWLLPALLVLQACGSTPIGQQLSESFDAPPATQSGSQPAANESSACLVGSEMCIRDRSLPEGKTADDITLAEAVELLEAKAAAKKTSRKKSTTAKKPAAKKPAAKKPAAKKPPATTKTGRLRASAVRVIKPGDA